MKLVVVESPAKAKTINKYLGNDYSVVASYGHVRDLPSKNGSVDPEQDFSMTWEVSSDSTKKISTIAKSLKKADTLILATDPDREGEAISWHIYNLLSEKGELNNKHVERVTFNEITKKAVQEAMAAPRDLNQELIDAYLARRALDYLVGFTISPILWRRLPGSKSAGRVQSVALRLICEREGEIEAFRTQEYWTIHGLFNKQGAKEEFKANLTHYQKEKLTKFSIDNEAQAKTIVEEIGKHSYAVSDLETKRVKRNPQPPFTTSTLQQEASRKLGFGASKTMRIAQQLYEGIALENETVGLITYMRTDSVHLSQDAISQMRIVIQKRFGDNYLPNAPRAFKSKAKNTQEAHEAVRPTDFMRAPSDVSSFLDPDQFKLYQLVWKRAMASQMAVAQFDQTQMVLANSDKSHQFKATGRVQIFDGFLCLYQEGQDDPEKDDGEGRLPLLSINDNVDHKKITPEQHFTEPPPRYTEASLVKKMEELGIGRPSTYASILNVIQARNYARLEKKRFIPEERGRLVVAFLIHYFSRYVEYDFTAALEDKLDDISNGQADWKKVLHDFWGRFSQQVDDIAKLKTEEILNTIEKDLDALLFPEGDENKRDCPKCEDGKINLKISKFGPFLGCSNYPECRYTRPLVPGEEGDEQSIGSDPETLGLNPHVKMHILLKKGPYGYYLQHAEDMEPKPKRVAIPKGRDPKSVTLEEAIRLMSLPREVGVYPETGEMITAAIGKYGPYLKLGSKFYPIPKDEDVLTIGINRAIDVIATKLAAEKGKSIGVYEETGEEVVIKTGRYGPYIQCGKTNVPMPRNETMDSLTLALAVELINKKKSTKAKK